MPSGALARANDGKTAVCHAAGRAEDPTFVEVRVSGGAVAAHLDDHGSPRAGHEGDYLVTDRTPCPPPTTAPNVRICKSANATLPVTLPAGMSFSFNVAGESVTIPVGSCVERTFRVGTPVTISETLDPTTVVDDIGIFPSSAGTRNVAGATATVVAGVDQATVVFFNSRKFGQFTLCKQIEPVGLEDFTFRFGVSSTFGPTQLYNIVGSPQGNCVQGEQYPVGTIVHVVESPPGLGSPSPFVQAIRLSSITVTPADRLVPGSLSMPGRSVSATIGEGTTTVTYVNARPVGYLQICKLSQAGITGSTRFVVGDRWFNSFSVEVPANLCSPVRFNPGPHGDEFALDIIIDIRELIPAGRSVTAITVQPPDRLVETPDLARGLVLVRVGSGVTTATFHNATVP